MSTVAAAASDCPLCNYSTPTKSFLLSHLRSVHGTDDDFFIACIFDGCSRSYSKCSSFVSHVYRQHRDDIIVEKPNRTSVSEGGTESDNYIDDNDCGISDVSLGMLSAPGPRTDLQHTIDQLLQIDLEEQQKKGALYLLNLKEIRHLSQTAVDHVVKKTQDVFVHTIGHIKAGVHDCLSTHNIFSSDLPDLDLFFSSVEDPFHGLNSTYLQENFYRNHLGCMVSTCTIIATYLHNIILYMCAYYYRMQLK